MQGKGRVLRGGRLVKTARGVVSLAAVVGSNLVAGGAFAQELDCTNPPIGGPVGSELCNIGDIIPLGIDAEGSVIGGYIVTDAGRYAVRWTESTGIEQLGVLEGDTNSLALGISSDGSVIVGVSGTALFEAEGQDRAFRWTQIGGMQSLGTLDGANWSIAFDTNSNGTVIVGVSGDSLSGTAFRWIEGQGMENLGVLPGYSASEAVAVDASGNVVVGSSTGAGGDTAFRWVDGIGMESLGSLSVGDDFGSRSTDVSADGKVVVGSSWSNEANAQLAFRWVEGSGMMSLGALDLGHDSIATGVNFNGTVVVGSSGSNEGTRAFLWTDSAGMQSLGVLNGGNTSSAYEVNADGSVVIGTSDSATGERAFIWREAGGGMEDYENLILSFPVLANDSAVALVQSQFTLGEVMDQTLLAGDGKMAMSARAGLTHTERNPTHVGQRDTSLAALSFGYGLSDTLTVGASLGLNGTSLKNNAFDMETGRNIALWGLYSAGGTARTGLQFGAAIGYGSSEGEIARGRLLTDVILATGSSKVTTRAVEASLGYGFEQANGWLLTPSVTLAHFDTTRAGYSEAGAAFNAMYDAMEFSRTELTLAIEGEVKLGENGRLRIGGGIEQELNPKIPRLSGTTDLPALPTFDIEGDFVPNKTRPFVTAGYTHDFGNGSSVTADVKLGRAVYGNSPDIGLGVGYGWKF